MEDPTPPAWLVGSPGPSMMGVAQVSAWNVIQPPVAEPELVMLSGEVYVPSIRITVSPAEAMLPAVVISQGLSRVVQSAVAHPFGAT